MLNIFENYVMFYRKNNFLLKIKKLFWFSKLGNDSNKINDNDFIQLCRNKNFSVRFEKFLRNSYSKEELRDYFIVFHLLYLDHNSCDKGDILKILKNLCTENRSYKVIEEFVKRSDNFDSSFFSKEIKEFKSYLNENVDFKKSWNNLIKNEPGLLIKLGKNNERIDILMSLQNYNLTNDDMLQIKNESVLLKTAWVKYYQNQMIQHILTTTYVNENDEKKSKIKAYIHMDVLLNFYRVNGITNNIENISIMKKYIRNIELYHIVKMRNKLYIDDKNQDSLLNCKECKQIDDLIYMEMNSIINTPVKTKIIKF